MIKTLLALAGLALVFPASMAQQDSFRPGEVWRDDKGVHINAHGGGLFREGDTYYWFGEHKIGGEAGNKAEVGVHCYSSRDLYNWKDEGIALSVVDEPGHPIEKGCILERPKVIRNPKTGRYVMWFHLELKGKGYGSAYAGVAVADKVTGPYRFVRAGRVNPGKWPLNMPEQEKKAHDGRIGEAQLKMDPYILLKRDFKSGQMSRDMTLYVDDDGTAYHIYSSEDNRTTHVARLTDDYENHTGEYVRIFPGRSMEAPVVCKRNGKYYFIASGCTGWAPNKARSGVADSVMGEWKELGNPCVGNNANKTFGGQSTCILPVQDKGRTLYIFCADIWRPANAIDGRYMWLPIRFDDDRMVIEWQDEWTLDKAFEQYAQ